MDLIQCNRKKGTCRELSCFVCLVYEDNEILQHLSVMAMMSPRTVCMWPCCTGPCLLSGCLAHWPLFIDMSPLLSEIPSIHAQQCANHSMWNHIGTLYLDLLKDILKDKWA